MSFPVHRMRRLRANPQLRALVRENALSVDDFIVPLFAIHGSGIKEEMESLPNNYRCSIDMLVDEAKILFDKGIRAVLIFGIPARKDEKATEAYAEDGIVSQAIRALKKSIPELIVIVDDCLCAYTPHGHCGIMENGYLVNDASKEIIAKAALTYAQAGADMIAPPAMLDGQVAAIRSILDENRFVNTSIMAYSAKYASALYDPFFKQGSQSTVAFGDKRTHQMDYANSDEALREMALDIEEGADIVMVKPGLFYLDIVYRCKTEFKFPLAVYNVSGEYAMFHAAAKSGVINKDALLMEMLMCFKRAGADMIITYCAHDAIRLLKQQGV